jgi:hypothetical protein
MEKKFQFGDRFLDMSGSAQVWVVAAVVRCAGGQPHVRLFCEGDPTAEKLISAVALYNPRRFKQLRHAGRHVDQHWWKRYMRRLSLVDKAPWYSEAFKRLLSARR